MQEHYCIYVCDSQSRNHKANIYKKKKWIITIVVVLLLLLLITTDEHTIVWPQTDTNGPADRQKQFSDHETDVHANEVSSNRDSTGH